MQRCYLLILASSLWLATAYAQREGHHAPAPRQKPAATTVTLKVSGMHCEACAQPIENTLKKLSGVQTAKVSFKEKSAVVTYHEDKVSVQQIARTIAQTPSPMPQGKFDAALLLSVKGVRNASDAQRLSTALKGVKGVRQAEASAQSTAAVTFDEKPSVRLSDLVNAAHKAGFTATPLVVTGAHDSGHSGHDGHASQCGCYGK